MNTLRQALKTIVSKALAHIEEIGKLAKSEQVQVIFITDGEATHAYALCRKVDALERWDVAQEPLN